MKESTKRQAFAAARAALADAFIMGDIDEEEYKELELSLERRLGEDSKSAQRPRP